MNLPWLIGSVLLLLLLVPSVYFWHARQVQRVAKALSAEADRSAAAGDHAQAARYLYRLLQMQPQDSQQADTLVRLAQTYDRSVTRSAGKGAVIQWYYRAVGAAPQRLDLQLRLAELFLETNQFVLAAEQAETILAEQPRQPQALKLRALAQFGQFRQGRPLAIAQVVQELKEVQQTDPGDVAVAQSLASLYRETTLATEAESSSTQADAVMDALVHDASEDYRVYLARYRYRMRYGEEEADADLQRALQLAPAEPEVLLAAAQRAQMQRAYDQAAGFYHRLAEANPSDSVAYLGWGDCLYRQADVAGAVQAWQTGRESALSGRLPLGLRLAGGLVELDRLDEAAQELQGVDEALESLTAERDLSRRDALIASRDLLAAKLALAQQRPQEAIGLLRRVATTAKRQAEERPEESMAYQAWLLLGQTRLQLQQWEDAIRCFQRALQIVPHSAVARLGTARAWLALGREDQALEICEQAIQRAAAPSDLWRILAQLQLDRQLRLPPTDRQWDTVQQTLEKAQFAVPDAWELQLAQAQMLLARDGAAAVGEAMELLLAAEEAHRNVLPLWLNLVFVYENLGRQVDADRALDRVQALAKDPLQSRAWRAVLLGLRGQHDKAAQLLETGDQAAAGSSLLWLQRARLLLAYQKGIARDVHDALLSLVDAQPENTLWLAQLAELALSQRKGVEADRWISRLQEVEGPQGVLWKFFQARRLVLRMRSADGPDMERIDRLMTEIRQARPDWPGLQWLQGLVAELRGRPDEAIDAFSAAIRAGFRQEELWQRLVRLLHGQGRFAEAEQWLVQLKQPSAFGHTAEGMAWGSALQTQRLTWAIERAQEEVALHPQDASAQVWLARLLLLDDRRAEAKATLERARALNPQDAATLISLMASYLRVGDTSSARLIMERLAEHPDLAPPNRQLLLAHAYESLGERETAQQHYEAATRLAPDRVELQVQYAKFLQPLEPEKAEEVLRAALRQDPKQVEARRLLATWLLWRVDPTARQESFDLLRHEPSSDEQRASDQRLQAVLLLRQGSTDDLREARQVLEELVRDPAHVTLEDHWLLAGLYERGGRMAESEQQLRLLIDRPQPSARHLVAWVEFLLRRERPEEAQEWLTRLEQQTTTGWPTMTLRARVLQKLGQVEQIEPALEAFANQWLQQLPEAERQQRFMQQLAELYAAVGRLAAAERWYVRLSDRGPQYLESLALFRLRKGDVLGAIQTCAEPLQQQPSPAAAARLLRVLVQVPGDVSLSAEDAAILQRMLRQHPDDPSLLFAMSNWRLKQQRVDQAILLLRQLTTIDDRHFLAWNNLAALLAEDPDRLPEALLAIDRAIAAAGRPLPNLLDTKAVVLLRQQRNAEAASLSYQTLALPHADDPRFHFHLAVALQRLGRREQALETWNRAQQLGLNTAFLTESERELATALNEEFSSDDR